MTIPMNLKGTRSPVDFGRARFSDEGLPVFLIFDQQRTQRLTWVAEGACYRRMFDGW